MKRDNDYVRELLFEMEAHDDIFMLATLTMGASVEETKRYQHAKLLCDAGFFHEVNDGVYRMTNQGYDYLESVRSNVVWEKTKAGAAEIGGATLGIMRDLAVAYLKQEAKAKLGIDL